MTKKSSTPSTTPIDPIIPINPIFSSEEEILKLKTEELKAKEEQKKEEKKKTRQAVIAKRREEGARHEGSKKIIQSRKKPRHGKLYRERATLLDRSKSYDVEEAIQAVKSSSIAKFDASVDIHINVAAGNVRGLVHLPFGPGKKPKVAIASDSLIEEIEKGKIDFDVLVAHPSVMPKLAKLAKTLGPKGLMPTPKSGTVSENPEAVKVEIESGKFEYRADKDKVVHASIGRLSWEEEKIGQNLKTFLQALTSSKIVSAYLASTMGPSVRVKI